MSGVLITGSRQSASMENYVPQTYELVGGFAAGDDNTDSPPGRKSFKYL